VYRGNDYKVTIICRKHGEFEQWPFDHYYSGVGCPVCKSDWIRLTQEQFLQKCRAMHGDRYDYSKVEYHSDKRKVTIICRKHGEFSQQPSSHIDGQGCPRCQSSHGENEVISVLKKLHIKFVHRARLITGSGCHFDFYLPIFRFLIEYNGAQHYEPYVIFGGQEAFDALRQRDAFKKRWARANGYRLIVIPYTIVNIEGYLRKRLGYPAKEAA
jgi:Zn finger protein HypA/HybF involved in hydrogenase expression